MDPAVYARHFGVQSEANKVTVTRVAGNEIGYRRVVNTYRKDMNSTVNNIRREQKKLRRCMRGYRKKLDGDKKKKPFKFGWIANTSPEDDYDQREIDLSPNIGKLTHLEALQALDETVAQTYGNETTGMRANNVPPINALQAQVEAFLKAPNIKVKKKTEENKSHNTKSHQGRHRRRFVLGSGKIRSSDRTIREVLQGDEVDNYSLLSDSSDDERGQNSSPDDKGNQHNIEGRDSSKGLIRSKSVYFKPMDMSNSTHSAPDDLISGENVSHSITSQANGLAKPENSPDKMKDSVIDIPYDKDKARANDQITVFPVNKAVLPSILPLSHEGEVIEFAQIGEKSKHSRKIEIERNSHRKRDGQKSKKDVSFGDIAKLQHGLKTHKLFSLVDQLASKHGLVDDLNKINGLARPSRPKPIKKKIFITNPSGAGNLSLTQYSSVFYPMKYGYGQDVNDSSKESQKSPHLEQTAKTDATISSITDSGDVSEATPSFSTKISQIDINGTTIDDIPMDKNSGSPFLQNKKMGTYISGTDVSGSSPIMSPLLGQDDINIAVQEIQALQRHRGSRYQRQRRRSSMLEASQFIKSLNDNGKKYTGSKKMSFSMEMGSFNKRKDSVMGGEDNEMLPDIHKVPWSSALSRIKLVHTLADLTHII